VFTPLADIPTVRLISLQKGGGAEQLAQSPLPVLDLGHELDETSGAFMDTAAVMMNVDLVITSDTALAHLAGALAVPVWVALPFAPDWRWMLDRDDSPWYPTMRLFRQQKPGDWDEVFQRIAGELCNGPALGSSQFARAVMSFNRDPQGSELGRPFQVLDALPAGSRLNK
jgi:hypothetical protein